VAPGLWVVLTLVFLGAGLRQPGSVSEEALVREGVCSLLTANTTEGRQALVSSVMWPPVPVLATLLIRAFPGCGTAAVASVLLGAAAAALVLLMLERMFHAWGLGRLRYWAIAALAVHPLFLRAAIDGSSAMPVLCLVVLVAGSLVRWCDSLRLRALVYIGLGAACLLGTRFEFSVWLAVGFVLMVADLWLRKLEPGQRGAILLLMLLPVFYLAGLWLLMNWLIMGDWWYCLRSIPAAMLMPDDGAAGFVPPVWVAAAGPVILGLVSVIRRQRTGVWLAVMGFLPIGMAVCCGSRGMEWVLPAMNLAALALSAMSCAYLTQPVCGDDGRRRALPVLVFVLIAVLTIPAARSTSGAGAAADRMMRKAIADHVTAGSRYAKVFVAGYSGLRLVPPGSGSDLYVPAFDFSVQKAAHDYPGQVLYLLAPKPAGIERFDSLYRKLPLLYSQGAPGMIYDSGWGNWRLFRLVGAEPPLPVR